MSTYVSGGLNPNNQNICLTCKSRTPDAQHYGWGWCPLHNNASVSPTGGCSQHSEAEQTKGDEQ